MWRSAGSGPVNPQDLNRSAYALNNPLTYTDPTGHWEAAGALHAIAHADEAAGAGYGWQSTLMMPPARHGW